ncbi:MAG: SIS domain-containing protein [Promethearchaeota archaeon]
MASSSGQKIAAFNSAFQLLIRTAKHSVNTISQDPRNLAIFCQTLSDALENKDQQIHIVGVGRSNQVGMILGECLKDIGFSNRIFYLNENFVQPFNKGDVIIAITGSGWTKLTTAIVEEGIRKKCKVLTFTGISDSKVAKLSDIIIQNPLGYEPEDDIYPFSRKRAPLSPLGTIFELTSIVIGLGVINGVFKGSCTNGFNEGTTEILRAAEQTFDDLKVNPKVSHFINLLSDYCSKTDAKVFFFGIGLCEIIALTCISRFRSLGMNIHSFNDWRFRRKGDILIVISGSGVSSSTLNIVKNAKASQMMVFSITSFAKSQLALESDEFIVLHGREEEMNPENLHLLHHEMYLPKFEYTSLVTLEACVAQIAVNLGISDETI